MACIIYEPNYQTPIAAGFAVDATTSQTIADPPPPGEVPSCAEAGVLGVLPGIVGSIQAVEAIKLILGKGEPLIGRLLMFDAMEMSFRTLNVRRNSACPLCGDHPTVTELIDYEQFCGMPARE